MMTSTHALFGASVGAAVGTIVPDLAPVTIAVGFVGGALPDIDLLWTHRRTTHFPVYASLFAGVLTLVAMGLGTAWALVGAVFGVGFAVHPVMDALCGGVETRPWEATSERGVFDHRRGQWIRPRRVIRYAGAPEDFLCATAFAVPALVVTSGLLERTLLAVLLASGLFTVLRRRLPPITERLFTNETGKS